MMEFWKSRHAVAGIRHWENRHLACSGTTLVELMVATLIGIIVFTSWLSICNPKPVVRESYRRLAVEHAAGYLDLMVGAPPHPIENKKYYKVVSSGGAISLSKLSGQDEKAVQSVFGADGLVSVGYTLKTEQRSPSGGWPDNSFWAVVRLYDNVDVSQDDAGNPFFELAAFLK